MIPVVMQEPAEEAAQCTRCKAWRPLAAFNRDRSRSNGHDIYCRACRSIANYVAYANRTGKTPKHYRGMERPKLRKDGRIPKPATRQCDWCGERKSKIDMRMIQGSPVCPDCVPRVAAGERPQDRELHDDFNRPTGHQ